MLAFLESFSAVTAAAGVGMSATSFGAGGMVKNAISAAVQSSIGDVIAVSFFCWDFLFRTLVVRCLGRISGNIPHLSCRAVILLFQIIRNTVSHRHPGWL
jgi:hypothetical protein